MLNEIDKSKFGILVSYKYFKFHESEFEILNYSWQYRNKLLHNKKKIAGPQVCFNLETDPQNLHDYFF